MRVLVSGATGFIGSALSERLVSRGDRVRALVRPSSRTERLKELHAELAIGDVGDAPSLKDAVNGCDVVVHLAGVVKALRKKDLRLYNAEGTRNVARACAGASRPPLLVYVSSLAAAGPSSLGRPRIEEDAPSPVSAYGESKLAGERAIRELLPRIEASIVRPPIVYGPREKELIPSLIRMARAGIVLRLGRDKRYSVVHVRDLCDGILSVIEKGSRLDRDSASGVYFFDDGSEHGWDEIALSACAALGRSARVMGLPGPLGATVAAFSTALAFFTRRPTMLSFDKLKEMRQQAWTCSSARASEELGYWPRIGLAEGMRESVAAFLEPHRLKLS